MIEMQAALAEILTREEALKAQLAQLAQLRGIAVAASEASKTAGAI